MKEVWVRKSSPAADTGTAEIRLASVLGDAQGDSQMGGSNSRPRLNALRYFAHSSVRNSARSTTGAYVGSIKAITDFIPIFHKSGTLTNLRLPLGKLDQPDRILKQYAYSSPAQDRRLNRLRRLASDCKVHFVSLACEHAFESARVLYHQWIFGQFSSGECFSRQTDGCGILQQFGGGIKRRYRGAWESGSYREIR